MKNKKHYYQIMLLLGIFFKNDRSGARALSSLILVTIINLTSIAILKKFIDLEKYSKESSIIFAASYLILCPFMIYYTSVRLPRVIDHYKRKLNK
jgi:hypothetical protein